MAHRVPERGTRAPLFQRETVDFQKLQNENVIQMPSDKHIARHQVFPYALNVENGVLRTQRTAPVKHPLRRKCHTPEKLSTYEHDYTVLRRRQRPDEFPAGGSDATGMPGPFHTSASKGLDPAPRDGEQSDRGSRVSRFRATEALRAREEFHKGSYDKLHATHNDTFTKLREMKNEHRPLQITISGWGDTKWAPNRFPGQSMGHTERQVNLIQTIHTLNLRAPDIAHIIH